MSRISIVRTAAAAAAIATWRKRLFVATAKHATSPVDYFRLPIETTVTMGSHVGV